MPSIDVTHDTTPVHLTVKQIQKEAYDHALTKGFWDNAPSIGDKLALIHAEVSEALEEFRDGHMGLYYKGTDPKPEGFGIELADAVVRIADLAERLNIDLDEMIKVKMRYNKTRAHMHGGKQI